MKILLLNAIVLFLTILETNAQPGRLDSTFGTNGRISLGNNFTATAFQQDAKLVTLLTVSGNIVISRFDVNGHLDPTFGNGGTKTVDLGAASDSGISVAAGIDGKIVVLGSTRATEAGSLYNLFVLLRYNSDGTPDNTFGNGGMVRENLGQAGLDTVDRPREVAIANDGKIVVATQFGVVNNPISTLTEIRVRGYNADGSNNFRASINFPFIPTVIEESAFLRDLLIQKDGKIVVGGEKSGIDYAPFPIPRDNIRLLLVRLNSDGSRDLTFANAGTLIFRNGNEGFQTMAEFRQGEILVAGSSGSLFKINPNGAPDPGFGIAGRVQAVFQVGKIVAQDEGKIIVGKATGRFALARYNSNGTIDPTFGSGGTVTSDFGDQGISNLFLSAERIYAYGGGIEAAYLLNEPQIVGPESNTTSGLNALSSNTTGTANTAYGAYALLSNTAGSGNTGIGYNSLYGNTVGVNNTATGGAALALNSSGSSNVAYGVGAGFSQNNHSSTFIGTYADAIIPVTNSTAIGYQSSVNGSNQVRIGNTAVTSIGGFTNWSNVSDGRLKKNVSEDVPGLTFITQLRPITYNLDLDAIDRKMKTNIAGRQGVTTKALSIVPASKEELQAKVEKARVKYTGFVAQEVEQAAKKLGYDFSGVDVPKGNDGYYALRYAEFVVPLVKAVQELDTENKQLKKELEELKVMVSGITNKTAVPSNTSNAANSASGGFFEPVVPNPVTSSAVIKYHVPQNAKDVRIQISTVQGQVFKNILVSKGDGQVTLNRELLSAGSYVCSLLVNGDLKDSKQILIIK
jgi:uncharacterized delta-60 repeat protein